MKKWVSDLKPINYQLTLKKLNVHYFIKIFKNEIPLKLPALMNCNNNVEKKSSVQFFGVMLDEHISWIDHVRTVENKIAKNVGLIY